jgi:hypothetical protein
MMALCLAFNIYHNHDTTQQMNFLYYLNLVRNTSYFLQLHDRVRNHALKRPLPQLNQV